jgi:GT2 family glycosyltransferase
MDDRLAIVIPTYRRHECLQRLLDSIASETDGDVETVVVDQSPDAREWKERLVLRYHFVRTVVLTSPNLPAARNAGMKATSAEIILFVDDDAVVLPGCIQEHLRLHRASNIGAVAGRIRQTGTVRWAESDRVAHVDPHTAETTGNFDIDWEGPVLYGSGGHLSVRKEAAVLAGLFNKRFVGNALFEEVDFCYRLRRLGLEIRYSPRAVVAHAPPGHGGCGGEHTTRYLLDRMHNHALFYFLQVHSYPAPAFLGTMKNLAEYLSRKQNGRHSLRLLGCSAWMICKAYGDMIMSRLAYRWERSTRRRESA